MIESTIENKFKEYVNQRGCVYLKFSILGVAGFPDRVILGPNKLVLFIEWKRPGVKFGKRKGEALQSLRHDMLQDFGFPVFVLDDLAKAKIILNNEIRAVKYETDCRE